MRDREKQIIIEHQNTNNEFYYSLFFNGINYRYYRAWEHEFQRF